jgi:hypothetical protein
VGKKDGPLLGGVPTIKAYHFATKLWSFNNTNLKNGSDDFQKCRC